MGETTMETIPACQPGTVISGKYRVERLLGEGGMGVVVQATHLVLDEPVAIKFLLPEIAQNEEAAARFVREAKAALRIKSEHVARVLDIDRLEDGSPYMVIEYLTGSDLEARLAEHGPLPVAEAVDAIIHACAALVEAHARGVIHRDLKPANLFDTRDARGAAVIKVLDFGISKLMDEGAAAITKPATAMGSVAYMSPEQLQSSRDVDERTDIYALGVTLYELLAGRCPYDGETMPQVVAAALKGDCAPLTEWRPDVPTALEDVVLRAMAVEQSARQATAIELANDLAPFASSRGKAAAARFQSAAPPPIEAAARVSLGKMPADPKAAASAKTAAALTTSVVSPPRANKVVAIAGGFALLIAIGASAFWYAGQGAGETLATPDHGAVEPASAPPAAANSEAAGQETAREPLEPPPPASATATASALALPKTVAPSPQPTGVVPPKPTPKPPQPDLYQGRK